MENKTLEQYTTKQLLDEVASRGVGNGDEFKIIIEAVAKCSGYEIEEITESRRKCALERMIASYCLRRLTNMTFQEIARGLKRSDHSTIAHAYTRAESILENPTLENPSDEIKRVFDLSKKNLIIHRNSESKFGRSLTIEEIQGCDKCPDCDDDVVKAMPRVKKIKALGNSWIYQLTCSSCECCDCGKSVSDALRGWQRKTPLESCEQ